VSKQIEYTRLNGEKVTVERSKILFVDNDYGTTRLTIRRGGKVYVQESFDKIVAQLNKE
jgi:uncharacterized protein YlzI (FlbEa/FlbD family)